jgi:beta-phosphoglucomutase
MILIMNMKYKGVIFDLDGVIVTTDDCHYLAWKKMADEEGIYFDRTINERLRGVSRMESLAIILEKASKVYSDVEKQEMATRKNGYYVEMIKDLDKSAILPGALEFCDKLKSNGVKIAIGSSSKNARIILKQIGLGDYFDVVADGNDIKNSKPDPEVFLVAAERLGLAPKDCLVVEDANAGVDAGLAAGMEVLAVGFAATYEKATFSAPGLLAVKLSITPSPRHPRFKILA